jgi:predicted DNA-binding protein with PD1-like motif
MRGGHMLTGNLVYTTAEITLVEVGGARFGREVDELPGGSGYYELVVYEEEEP